MLVAMLNRAVFSENTVAQFEIVALTPGKKIRVRGLVLTAVAAQKATLQSASNDLMPLQIGAGLSVVLPPTNGNLGDSWAETNGVVQVSTLTVDTAADGDNFTIGIGEFTFTGVSSGTDAGVQATAIRALLSANGAFTAKYTVGGAGADVIVTAKRYSNVFVTSETVDPTSAYSWALTTPAGEALNISLANAVVTDGVVYYDFV